MLYKDSLYNPNISFDELTLKFPPPEYLYKYQSFGKYWRDNIQGAFHLSRGIDFEDFEDCKPYFVVGDVCDIVERLLRSNNRTTETNIQKILENLHGTLTQEYFDGVSVNYRTNIRIGCFTTSSCNEKMWTEYADCDKGFCIKYNTKKNFLFTHSTLPVLYSKTRYNSSLSLASHMILEGLRQGKKRTTEENLKIFGDVYAQNIKTTYIPIFIKGKEKWGFEKEYRMFLLPNRSTRMRMLRSEDVLDASNNIDLSNSIEAIFLGENFNLNIDHDKIKSELLDIAKNKNIHVFQKNESGDDRLL